MRISKETARITANKLTESADKKVQELHKAYVDLAIGLYNAQFPKEVLDFAEKYPQHVCHADHINLDGHGFSRDWVSIGSKSIIANVEGYAQGVLKLTAKTADALKKAKSRWQDAQKEYKSLKDETQRALLNLRTTTRIHAELPIASPFLKGLISATQYPVPVLNLAPLKAKLQKLQKV